MPVTEFAILAPVPREHLESGKEIAESTGYVCFGSDLFELFRKVDQERHGAEVPVLLYASHTTELADWGYVIAWRGVYVGCVEDADAKRAEELAGHRPPTTRKYPSDNASGWGVFWKVKE